ncbi:MAG: restriction endonuclease subunit S, partial [Burkholderiaceae bacterium]|nr:restriction endonuclease subunit S [Burkholderiaceae bacterium]
MSEQVNVPLRKLLVALESGSRPKGGVKGIDSGVPNLGREQLDSNGGFRLDRIRYVPTEFAATMRRGQIKAGDILVVKDGATTGKVSLVRKSFPYSDAVVNEHVFLCRCGQNVDSRYVFWYLFSARGQREILSDFRGAAQGGISQRFADLIEVPLQPLDQQHRIVAEIEKQFSRLDEAVANLKRVKANLKRYKAAVLKSAVEGRLVPTEAELARCEGRNYESGAQLLQRILEARRSRWKGKYHEPDLPEIAELQGLPEGWTYATAEQLTDAIRPITYGVIKLGEYVEGGVPVLRSSDVRWLQTDLDGVKTIAPEIADNYRRTFLEGGEVVITVRGTLGGVAVVPQECRGFNISREVAMLAFVKPDMARTVAFFLASSPIERWLLSRAKGIAYTGINIETLKALPVPVPPMQEQARIG